MTGVGASFEKMPSWIEFVLVREVLRGWRALWVSRSSFLPATASSSVTVWRIPVLGRMSGEERVGASAKMPP